MPSDAAKRLASNLAAAFVLGAVAGVAQNAARRRPARQMINWDRVYQIGSTLSGNGLAVRMSRPERDRLDAHFQGLIEQVTPRMLAYLGTGSNPSFAFGTRAEALDRAAWIEANIGSFGTVFEPVEEVLRARYGRQLTNTLNQQSSSIMLGVLMGYLSRRVLGQYDPALLGKEAVTAGRLYFVAPNLDQARRQMGLPKDQFETWVVFHEMTHSWQFEAHPWLREFMNERVRELLVSASGKLAQFDAGEVLRLAMRGELDLRRPDRLLTGLMTPDQRRIFDQLQALMSLLEGFSNHVMDALGPDMLPDYSTIAAQFERRHERKSQAERLFVRMTGLEMKMEQYRIGEAFVNQIVADKGIAFMNRIWEGPESLPSLREIYDPSSWVARMNQPAQ
ncbi:MAG TPA: zinc-dependent metalloprotease [Chloroflexota bacterium]|nr:zinc-dependent metalloprotease [Chloroflexota bacterium]